MNEAIQLKKNINSLDYTDKKWRYGTMIEIMAHRAFVCAVIKTEHGEFCSVRLANIETIPTKMIG